ncbi:hypothetical protein ILUMI_16009 [Ignelater luminosus]|uniref:Uncharacterized protein n=1 Tax=Ignelater luminosus TaxID=2038154 RepID=A0A8K0CPE3_IGNLU|nr:hypothetical protein ILUMI_16009 [Ignelater luminosus]
MSSLRDVSKETIAPYIDECLRQSGLNPQIEYEYHKYGRMSEDPCWKCFLKCLAFKLEIVSSTGDVNIQRWIELFPHLNLPLAEKCSSFKEPDLYQKAYLMLKCVYDEFAAEYPE